MNPFTATLNILFVVALYSARRIILSSCWRQASDGCTSVASPLHVEVGESREAKENVRWTRGDSSASTCRARRAAEARRWVGSGMSIVLWDVINMESRMQAKDAVQ